MAQQGESTAQQALAVLAQEARQQTALLEQLCGRVEWEYLLVQINAQRGSWYQYYANGMKLADLDNKPVYYVLNTLGEQGWELIEAMPSGDFYFKRQKA